MAATFGTTQKLMSISRGEFEASARALDPNAVLQSNGTGLVARYALSDGAFADVSYTLLPPRVIGGGLLSLPQAEIMITFTGHLPAAQIAFLLRFETSFQRGGG